jgi:UDP-3-O-acyl-N-acetylglucosamine deacetylase
MVGEITAHRAGHALHSRFVAKVLAIAAQTDEDFDSASSSETVFA